MPAQNDAIRTAIRKTAREKNAEHKGAYAERIWGKPYWSLAAPPTVREEWEHSDKVHSPQPGDIRLPDPNAPVRTALKRQVRGR